MNHHLSRHLRTVVIVASVGLFVGGIAKLPDLLDGYYSGKPISGQVLWSFAAFFEIVLGAGGIANNRSRVVTFLIAGTFLCFAIYSTSSFIVNRDCECLGAPQCVNPRRCSF